MFPILALLGLTVFSTPVALGQSKSPATTKKGHDHNNDYAELARAPLKSRLTRNPLEHDPDAVEAGGKLFEQHCSECHGRKGEGKGKAPSLVRDEVQEATPGALFWILTNGVVRHGMPVWSKLPEPQRWQLVAFLKSLGANASLRPFATPQ
jgi:mono/diheme cytochrome c family protein